MASFGVRRPTFWMLSAILASAAFVRFRALDFGLPHTQARPDETAIIDPVRILLSGHLPNFFDYPWLFLWIVAVAYLGYYAWGALAGTFGSLSEMLASWPTHWEPFFLIPRAIVATAGTITVLVIYKLGRQLHDEATGLVAAFFLAFTLMHARSSHFGTTDVVMTLLITLATVLMADAHRSRTRAKFLAAGVAAGLAAATKYNAVLLVVPMVTSHLLNAFDSPGHRRAALLDPGIFYFGVAFAVAFGIGVPFVVVDQARFLAAMRVLSHALQTGDARLDLDSGWIHNVTFSLRYGIGLPLLVTGLAGAAAMLWLEPRKAILFLSFPVAYYMVASNLRLLFVRYTMPLVPFLCVAAAYLVCRGVEWLFTLRHARAIRRPWPVRLATATVAIALISSSVVRVWAFDQVLSQTDNRVMVSEWFANHVAPGSSVLQSGSRYGLAQFDRRLAYTEWRWDGGRGIFLIHPAGQRSGIRPAPDDRPAWIVIQDSPLPSTTQEIVLEFLKEDYALAAAFKAFSRSDDLVYDQLDAFFVPFSGFENVTRPGPNFAVYKRHGLPADDETRSRTP